jgi:hypothetical protein
MRAAQAGRQGSYGKIHSTRKRFLDGIGLTTE